LVFAVPVLGLKKRKVLVCGVFDLLHLGHLHFFSQAKKFGNHLTVLVARDSTVKKVKPQPPFFKERERMELLSSLKIVDRVVLGSKKSLFEGVRKVKPDVLVLGFDQLESAGKLLGISHAASEKEIEKTFLKKGLNLKVIRLNKGWMPTRFKSRKVKEHLKVK
jgi:FAD synthetase